MGLNYVRRPRREELDPPNIFVSYALGLTDIQFKEQDEQLILDFENEVLDGVQRRYRDIDFLD